MKTNIALILSAVIFILTVSWFMFLKPEPEPLGVAYCILKTETITSTYYTVDEAENFANHCNILQKMEK